MKYFIHVSFKEIEEEIKKDIENLTIDDATLDEEENGFVLTVHYKTSEPYIKEILAQFVEGVGFHLLSSEISEKEDEYICEVEKLPEPSISVTVKEEKSLLDRPFKEFMEDNHEGIYTGGFLLKENSSIRLWNSLSVVKERISKESYNELWLRDILFSIKSSKPRYYGKKTEKELFDGILIDLFRVSKEELKEYRLYK